MATWTEDEIDAGACAWDRRVMTSMENGSMCGAESRAGAFLVCEVTALREALEEVLRMWNVYRDHDPDCSCSVCKARALLTAIPK